MDTPRWKAKSWNYVEINSYTLTWRASVGAVWLDRGKKSAKKIEASGNGLSRMQNLLSTICLLFLFQFSFFFASCTSQGLELEFLLLSVGPPFVVHTCWRMEVGHVMKAIKFKRWHIERATDVFWVDAPGDFVVAEMGNEDVWAMIEWSTLFELRKFGQFCFYLHPITAGAI